MFLFHFAISTINLNVFRSQSLKVNGVINVLLSVAVANKEQICTRLYSDDNFVLLMLVQNFEYKLKIGYTAF